jgi:hypothetical protein
MSSLVSPPSCGLSMLRAPDDTFDFILSLTSNDKERVSIHCHRAVLRCHSPKLSEYMTGHNYFYLEIKLPDGYLGSCIELIQYMYIRDISKISDREKILKLCAMFEMPLDFFLIRKEISGSSTTNNNYRTIELRLSSDSNTSTCLTIVDFLKHLEFDGIIKPKDPTCTRRKKPATESPKHFENQRVEPRRQSSRLKSKLN